MRIDIRPAPASALNNLKAVGALKLIELTWTLPFMDASYRAAQVWVNTVNDRETAMLVGTVGGNLFSYPADDTNTRYFWVRAVNEFGRSDGPFTGPAASAAKSLSAGDVSGMVFDLASANVIGQLAKDRVSGLGALAILDTVGIARITGLGNLATQNTVNASTQVTNLGALAYANSLAANQVGAGTLSAGVIYSGTINADKINVGTLTGHIFRTASFGQRVSINEGSNNRLAVYDSNGGKMIEMGGTAGNIWVAANSGGLIPGIYATMAGPMPAIYGSSSSGVGVTGSSVSTIGVEGFSSNSYAVKGRSNTGIGGAFYADGRITTTPYSESSHRGDVETNNCVPISDNTYNLGTFARRWMGVVSASAVIVSSDARMKEDIEDSDLGLDFIKSLRSVSYRLREGRNEITHEPEQMGPIPMGQTTPPPVAIATPVAGARRHYGLLAQEVKEALGDKDAAFWVLENPSDPESSQALRYEELISPLIKAVQELSAIVQGQQVEIELLKLKLENNSN